MTDSPWARYDIHDNVLWKEDAKGRPVAIHLASLLVQEEFFILRRRQPRAVLSLSAHLH